ncbi:MAG: carbonic anhydrase [Oscillospiraceae bacterium]|nr:carbonic anhydrase [Oscillospiraceae bacterium]
MVELKISPEGALKRLKEGNDSYIEALCGIGDTSPECRKKALGGQQPYAVIITCSDSRVIPEAIFSAGIGELFVIRVAGNVIDDHQLGSIEYATGHLGTGLVVVLGHNHCGAVGAAMGHSPNGYIKSITDEIVKAIGDERDDTNACRLNALHSKKVIEESLKDSSLKVVSALYCLETGKVEFFE